MAPSRYSRNKKKGDKVLNWAIGVVSVLILVIGGIILISLLKSPGHQSADQPAQQQQQTDKKAKADQKSSSNQDKSSDKSQNSSDSNKASNAESDSATTDASQSSTDSQNNSDAQSNPDSQNSSDSQADPNAGTAKTDAATKEDVPDSEHHASYDKGSADWNAQVAALSAATGIPQDNMILYWLGNGGDPNSSIGRLSSKDKPDAKYVVKLEYQNQQWQAVNVQKP